MLISLVHKDRVLFQKKTNKRLSVQKLIRQAAFVAQEEYHIKDGLLVISKSGQNLQKFPFPKNGEFLPITL